MLGVLAESPEDAAGRVQALRRSAVLIGSAEGFTPVEVEYGGERQALDYVEKGATRLSP